MTVDGIRLPTQRFHAWCTLGLPIFVGGLIGTAVLADSLLARGLSLRFAAPWLRGEAPPLITLVVALLVVVVLALGTVLRGWLPRPELALITLLFVATQLVGFSIGNVEPLKICLLVVAGCWLFDALANDRALRLYPPFLMMWLVILAFAFASSLNGLLSSLIAQYTIAAKFLMFFIVANLIRTPGQLVFTVRLLVGLGMASAVLALVQEALFYFLNIALTLDDNASKFWFKETPIGWMIRATALHSTSQNLSHFLLIAFALLLLGPFSASLRTAGLTLIALAIFFTFSGNALVVLAFVVFMAPIVRRPRIVLQYVGTLLLGALVAYQTGALGWAYNAYLLPLSEKSAEDRVGLLQLGFDVVERHPLIGIGLNNFGRLSPQPVHNAYMQMTTEIGVVPGVLLCLILLLILCRLLIGTAATPVGRVRQAGQGVLLGFMALAVHFLFEPFINSLVSWSIIGLAEAAALLLYVRRSTGEPFFQAILLPSWRAIP